MTTSWPSPEKLYIEEKPGIRYYLIMAVLPQLPSELDRQVYHQEALAIRKRFDEQVSLAKRYIAEGNRELAVSLFERLVEKGYDQVYPYTYLKDHYAINGKQAEEEKVINQFQALVQTMERKRINRPDLVAVRDKDF